MDLQLMPGSEPRRSVRKDSVIASAMVEQCI